MVDFARGQRKDDLAHDYLRGFEAAGGSEGVLFVGRAQEKNRVFRTEKRRNPVTGATYPWIVSSTGVINQFYFYCLDGHEWAKRQAVKAGIGFTALDNGFAACEDPVRLQRVCHRLNAGRSTRCCASGWRSCRTRSPTPTGRPATGMTSPCCRSGAP